jgi:serine/threonine protein kinase
MRRLKHCEFGLSVTSKLQKKLDSTIGVLEHACSSGLLVTKRASSDSSLPAFVGTLPKPRGEYGPGELCTVTLGDRKKDLCAVADQLKEVEFDAAETEDDQGRTLLNIAEGIDKRSELAAFIRTKTFFFGSYKIAKGPVVHKSDTCIVVYAEDHYQEEGSDNEQRSTEKVQGHSATSAPPVVLKLMKNQGQYNKEVDSRSGDCLDSQLVVNHLRSHDSESFLEEIQRYKGAIFKEYHFCLVMPAGDRNLLDAINSEHFAGEDMDQVRAIMRQLAKSLQHLHEQNIIHADFKPKNAVRVGGNWLLIDLDAVAEIGEPVGTKSSTAYIPPELLDKRDRQVIVRKADGCPKGGINYSQGNGFDENGLLLASVTFDVWSFGVVLYHMVTGEQLFKSNTKDNLDAAGRRRLHAIKLKDVHTECRKVWHPHAKDLLLRLLDPNPLKRVQDFADILIHPFLDEDAARKEIEELKLQLQHAEGTKHSELLVKVDKLTALAEDTNTVAKKNSNKLDQVIEQLCGLEQMGLDQIEGKLKCPSVVVMLHGDEPLPVLGEEIAQDVWEMISPKEGPILEELESKRQELRARVGQFVEGAHQALSGVTTKRTWNGFFSKQHSGETVVKARKGVEDLVSAAQSITEGYLDWAREMLGVFCKMFERAKALQKDASDAEDTMQQVAELVKLMAIVAQDSHSSFKDLKQWGIFCQDVFRQWESKLSKSKKAALDGANTALKETEQTRKSIRQELKERLPIALEWLVLNGKALHESYSQIKDIGSSFCNGDLDKEETETEDRKNEGNKAEDEVDEDKEDVDEDEEGSDFMSDM